MPAVEQGALAARPQQALGGCGGSTRKTPLASKCKSWEQTLCSCQVSQADGQHCLSATSGAGFDEFPVHTASFGPGGPGLACLYINQLV